MQIFRYMAFIWEDYEKEQNRKHQDISKTKGFKYPPILPIVYYEGRGSWTAPTRLHDRVYLSDVLGEYIPDYRCIMVQLNEYTNRKLMEKEDELSVIMMLNKLHEREDFVSLKEEVPLDYLKRVTSGTPEYLLGIMEQVIEILLSKLNVPQEEAEESAGQVKERKMGELFAVLEENLQRDRQRWKEEGIEQGMEKGIEEGIKAFVLDYMEEGISGERLLQKLQKRFKLSEEKSRYYYDKFHGYLQKDAASYLQITRKTYSYQEKGCIIPPTNAIYHLAKLNEIPSEIFLDLIVGSASSHESEHEQNKVIQFSDGKCQSNE